MEVLPSVAVKLGGALGGLNGGRDLKRTVGEDNVDGGARDQREPMCLTAGANTLPG